MKAQKSNCARILVVEDCELFRRAICLILQQTAGVDVVDQACDGLEAVTKAVELRPDLILLDIALPKQNGLLAARQIRKLAPESKILFLSEESDPEIVQESLDLGASGYVAKMAVAKELIAATRAVLREEQFISGILAPELLRGLLNSQIHLRFEYDPESKILRGKFQGPVTDQSIANGYRLGSVLVRDIDIRGSIADFSSVTTVDVNQSSIHQWAALPPVDPVVSRPRVIVAPSGPIFGLAELFQKLGKGTRPNLHVVRSSYDALVLLGVVEPRFRPIEEQLPI